MQDSALIVVNKSQQEVVDYVKQVSKIATDPVYIQYKQGFPYVPSKYIDWLFNTVYPVNEVIQVQKDILANYFILYTIQITVFLPNGQKLTKIGSGGTRIQVKASAKAAVENGQRMLNPFDYVDASNSDKAALTVAISNCQARFGIAADVYDRIILSPEQIAELDERITTIIENVIINPMDRARTNAKYKECKNANEKLKLLKELVELYEVEEELQKEENK